MKKTNRDQLNLWYYESTIPGHTTKGDFSTIYFSYDDKNITYDFNRSYINKCRKI